MYHIRASIIGTPSMADELGGHNSAEHLGVFPKLSGQKSPKYRWHSGLVGLNFAQFWEHLDERNRGRILLWSFNNPNPVFAGNYRRKIWFFSLKKIQKSRS